LHDLCHCGITKYRAMYKKARVSSLSRTAIRFERW
jgi:hypothetical protein